MKIPVVVTIGVVVVLVNVTGPLTGCGTVACTVGRLLGAGNVQADKFGMTWLVGMLT